MFGDWLESRGHRKCLEWVEEEAGWRLKPVQCKGEPVLPSAISIVEYVFKVRSSNRRQVVETEAP